MHMKRINFCGKNGNEDGYGPALQAMWIIFHYILWYSGLTGIHWNVINMQILHDGNVHLTPFQIDIK